MDFLPKLIFFLAMIQIVLNECCVKFTDGKCVECPKGMHLFRDNCIYDVDNCQTYKDGFDCDVCKKGYELKEKKCVLGNTSSLGANQSQTQTGLDYKVVTIDFKNLSSIQNSDIVDEFTISDEIFKSNFDKDLRNTQITRADQRTYTNGTITIVIEYRNNKNESYEGEMLVNLKTFIFKIIDWKKSTSNDPKANPSSNDSKNTNDQKQNNSSNNTPLQQPNFTISFKPFNSSFSFPQSPFTSTQLDLSNPQQIQQMALLDQQSSTYLQEQLKTLPNNTITMVMKNPKSQKKLEVTEMEKTSRRVYKQKNMTIQFIVLFYKTSDKNVEYIAVGQVSSDIKEGVLPVKLVYAGFDQTLLQEKKNVTVSTNTTTPNGNTSNTTTTNTSKPNTSTNTNATNTSTNKSNQSLQQLISKMTFTHIKDDVTLLNDIFYMITKDEIVKKNKMFEDLEPEKVQRASLDDKNTNNSKVTELKTFNYYRITYVTGKNQTYQVVGHCNIVTYDPFVDEVKLLGQNITETNKNSSSNASQTNTGSQNNTNNMTQSNTTSQNTSQANQTKANTTQQTSQSNSTQQNSTHNTNVPKTNQTSQPVTNSSSNSSVASNQSSSSTSKFVVPEGFISVQKQSNISANVYYLIAMDTLSNRDKKFFDLKPTLVYTKEQPSSNKIQFFMKFEIAQPIKSDSTTVTKQIWAVLIEVTKSSFKAQILKNQLVETTSQPINYKQQSEQVQQLKKDDLITKNTTSTVRPAIGSGKVVLLRQDKDRILFEINSENDFTIKSTKNLRSTS